MNKDNPQQNIVILGSTGSIGTQTLDVVRQHPDRFGVSALVAKSNWQLLANQAIEFKPDKVVIADSRFLAPLRDALSSTEIKVETGEAAVAEAAAHPDAETVVTAMVGYSGLIPTIEAIKSGKTIALANKETLVVAGQLITSLVKACGSRIIPVDSEHSAIFQCLVGEDRRKLHKIYLTASGGPFRTLEASKLPEVTAADALKHPNWSMGAKVTIDSASMMNKGFEMIEAKWLFGCNPDDIEVIVHPQSIVHSMVEFIDGSVKAQLGIPDMRLPIRYALGYPERLTATPSSFLHPAQLANLTFESPDMEKFPLLGCAFEAIRMGGNMPCILNAANEVAVKAFLEGRIRFTDMPVIAGKAMESCDFIKEPTLDELVETNSIAAGKAGETACELGFRS